MNCQEFELTIFDLSCDRPMEVQRRAHALAHQETCEPCAARLNREQRIAAGLQAFAAEEAAINAPERVRSALRAAFDQQQAANAAPPVPLRPASNPSASNPSASNWSVGNKLVWGLVAAATLLVFAMSTALWMRGQKSGVENVTSASPASSGSQPLSGRPSETLAEVQPASERHATPSLAARPSSKPVRRRTLPVKKSAGEASELFPLTFVAKSGPTEFLQTVRVEISRSTLLSMGLPINIDRGEGPIKADIIIGEDGVARAVRIFN